MAKKGPGNQRTGNKSNRKRKPRAKPHEEPVGTTGSRWDDDSQMPGEYEIVRAKPQAPAEPPPQSDSE